MTDAKPSPEIERSEPAWMTRLGEIADDLWQRGDKATCSALHSLRSTITTEVAAGHAEALGAAKADIKARIRRFNELKADPEYINALNDAWGLVANRERDALRATRTAADAGESRG